MSNLLRKAALSAIGGSLLVATLGLAPAAAERPDTVPADRQERAGGHGGDAAATAFTEDTDTNDGGTANNVVDDGDNLHPSGNDRSVEGGSGTQGASTSDPDDDGRGPDRSNGGPDKPNGAGGDDLADQDGNNGCGNDDDFEDDNEGWCGNKPKPEHEARFASTSEPERKPCPNGSMTRPCAEAGAAAASSCPADEAAEADDADAMTAGCDRTEAAAEHQADAAAGSSCPADEAADDTEAMPAGCEDADADADTDTDADVAAGAAGEDTDDSDDTEVLGLELTRGGAAGAEVADSTVSAQGSGGVLAGVPVLGSLIEGELPMTGISTLSFLIFALAAMVIGSLLVRASRRTRVSATS